MKTLVWKISMIALSIVAAGCVCAASNTADKPMLKPGDRMVFLGDSITEQQIYTRYVMNYFALRYPGANITFRNAGWGGDTAPGGLNRLQRDVLSLKPTVVSICFGMNDGGYQAFKQGAFDNYMKGMTGLVSELKKAGVGVVLLTPGCVDPDRNKDLRVYNDTLGQLAEGVKKLAARENLPVFDLHALMLDVQTRAKSDDPSFTMIPDAVHPSQPGQAVMAYALLKAMGCGAASALTIDAESAVSSCDRCKVRNLKVSEGEVSFTRSDDALPAYFDPEAAAAFKYVPITEELNRYSLKATGLKSGTWKLTVQGIEVGTFPTETLSAGVNLSTYPGPWRKLGEETNRLVAEQEGMYFNRWRNIGLSNTPQEAQPELQALVKKLDTVIASREASRIKKIGGSHSWEWSLVFAQ